MLPAAALPIPPSPHVETLLLGADGLTSLASSETPDAPCPRCGERAGRVHTRSGRVLADLPWATLAVHLRVHVRKFFSETTPPARARSSPNAWRASPRPPPAAPTVSASG